MVGDTVCAVSPEVGLVTAVLAVVDYSGVSGCAVVPDDHADISSDDS